jgi:glycosyltransferase involved in cell wall biosynthesis
MSNPRVAIVHEWFTCIAGSERVVEQMLLMYPQADLFALVDTLLPSERGFLGTRAVQTSALQKLPGFLRRRFRGFLPVMPFLIEQTDLAGYDLVLSSSHAVAKGVLCTPDQIHVSYIHSPMRYAWDLQARYLRESNLGYGPRGLFARAALHYLRGWDFRSAQHPDQLVANSQYIARRIRRCWNRDASVVHPPVAIHDFSLHEHKDNFYLAASRLVPYKRMPLIAEAFSSMPERKLIIVGDGPERQRIENLVRGRHNIEYLGYQPTPALRDLMQRARALVFAAEEDFGILPVETMACGTPVIAYGRGGILDSVTDGMNGILFPEQSVSSIMTALVRFEQSSLASAADIRATTLRFSPERFRTALSTAIGQTQAAMPPRRAEP